jgi:tetratricopeptide (TPR) repeat protein
VAAGGLAVYRGRPWAGVEAGAPPSAPDPAPPASSTAEQARAARATVLTGELERMLAEPVTFAALPVLEGRLAQLRRVGATSAADRLATQAAAALERAAAAELDMGAIDVGISHYKLALAVDPAGGGQRELAERLRSRGEAALAANRGPEAVRWAREALSLAEADPDAHALLGAALLRSRDFAAAAAEYGKALSSRPQDAVFRRGLSRARRGLVRPSAAPAAAPAPAPAREASPPVPPSAAPAAPPDDDQDKDRDKGKDKEETPGSPAGEPASEQQQ